MKVRLQDFSRGRISISTLSAKLEVLNLARSNPSAVWLRSFHSSWSALEEVNALMLEREALKPNGSESVLIDRSVHSLLRLIDEELRGPEKLRE
jgi:hypothetical protein